MKKNPVPLAPPSAPDGICKSPPCLNENNQSEPGGVCNGVSVTAPAHCAAPLPHTLAQSSSISSAWSFRWSFLNKMAQKHPATMKKTAHPPLPITAYSAKHVNTSRLHMELELIMFDRSY